MEQTRRNAIYYLIATVIGKASGLILIPLYLLILTPQEAGLWAMLSILRVLVSAVSTASIDGYLTQEYWHRPATERSALVTGCLNTVMTWNAAAMVVVVPLLLWEPARWWALTCLGAQASGVINVALARYRIEERAGAFCLMACFSGGGGSLLAAGLAVTGMGVAGIALGFALPPMVVAIWLRLTLSKPQEHDPHVRGYVYRVLPARLVAEAVGQADRIVLTCFVGAAQLGLYDLAARCAGVVGTLLSSLKQAVLPSVLRSLSTGANLTAARTTWNRGLLIAVTAGFAMICGGWVAAIFFPTHPWSPALVYLPGALSVPLWAYAALGNAAAIYHHRMVKLQAIIPVATLMLVIGGTAISGWISPLGIAWGMSCGLAASVFGVRQWLITNRQTVMNDGREFIVLILATLGFFVIFLVIIHG